MADLIQAPGFNRHSIPTSPRSFQNFPSFSGTTNALTKASANIPRPLSQSISSSSVSSMTAVSSTPAMPTPRMLSPFEDEEGNMSTLPDPRSRNITPTTENSPASPSQHPDLSNEVATLSNKLINAINHQTNLDDTLSATRLELETARNRIKQLEKETQEHKDYLARGILVRKSIVNGEKNVLVAKIAEEKKLREEVEKEKKVIEQELENLTTALFEEAQKMVVKAREDAQKEHDALQRKNDQLKAQLDDTQGLLKSQQEQLAELKRVMEHMTEERDDQSNQTAPSTPGLSKIDSKDELGSPATNSLSSSEPISPSYPTSFTHLLQTVLRTDLSSYDDFKALLKMSKNIVGSRASSGSYGSIGLGLGLGGYAGSFHAPSNGSTSSIATAGTLGSTPVTPTTPASSVSAKSTNEPNSLTPLNKTEFYKRALAEDIEPTLRLDAAPGLSWLARRNVQNAICDGTLVVDPMPTSTKPYSFPCSLCGESRKDPSHSRSHRFRTSESDSAQKYPLCKYCLGRVRSTCDFIGFLRILKDGHWRADDAESEKAAWEESVRLREQMFWARVGGGVVPATQNNHGETASKSPRLGEDERKERELKEDLNSTTNDEVASNESTAEGSAPPGAEKVSTEDDVNEDSAPEETSKRESPLSLQVDVADGENEEATKLSITIPGSN